MRSTYFSLAFFAMIITSGIFAFVTKPFASAIRLSSTLAMSSFYDITEKDANGESVSFSKFKGKVVYGVNVATKCGYTASGYALLGRIAKLKSEGVEVAIFPCNQVRAKLYSLLSLPTSSQSKISFVNDDSFPHTSTSSADKR
jgi:Glutathione peroxidase